MYIEYYNPVWSKNLCQIRQGVMFQRFLRIKKESKRNYYIKISYFISQLLTTNITLFQSSPC